jgi:hypothetical protein
MTVSSIDPCDDLLRIPEVEKSVVRIFSGFHHFREEQAVKLLWSVVQSCSPFYAFEFVERNVLNVLDVVPGMLVAAFTGLFKRRFSLATIISF